MRFGKPDKPKFLRRWELKKGSKLQLLFQRNGQLIVLIFLGIVTLILGLIGFWRQFPDNNFSENLYLTLQLFVLQSGAGISQINWQLDIARYIGAFFSAWAAIQLLVSIFSNQYQLLKILLFFRDHVIICGLGGIGTILTERYLSEGRKVVIIEIKQDNKYIQHLKELGAIILIGDGADPELLRKAGIAYAELVVAVCGNDGKNSEIVSQVAKLAREGILNIRLERFLQKIVKNKSRFQQRLDICCYAHILDLHLCHYLAGQAIMSYTDTHLQVEFFNIFDSGARLMLQEKAMKFSFTDGHYPHIAVIGLNEVGQSLIMRLERAIHAASRNDKPCLTIIDPEASDKIELMNCSCANLENSFDLKKIEQKVQNTSYLNSWLNEVTEVEKPLTHIFICLEDDSEALTLGLMLQQRLRRKQVPIMVCLLGHGGLEEILVEREGTSLSPRKVSQQNQLFAFDLLERTCDSSISSQGLFEDLAVAVHGHYCAENLGDNNPSIDQPNLYSWFAEGDLRSLSDELKEQNRRQARRIGEALWSIGYGIEPMGNLETESILFEENQTSIQKRQVLLQAIQTQNESETETEYYERLAELSKQPCHQVITWGDETIEEDDFEYTARQEHESWFQAKLKAGYRWDTQKDETAKTNPNVLPWYDPRLSEEYARQITREMVRFWPDLLRSVGLRIYRR